MNDELMREYESLSALASETQGFHDNGHDDSGGDSDYHNDSHDNTPSR